MAGKYVWALEDGDDANLALTELRRNIAGWNGVQYEKDAHDVRDLWAFGITVLTESLDTWLSNGGELPDAWKTNRS